MISEFASPSIESEEEMCLRLLSYCGGRTAGAFRKFVEPTSRGVFKAPAKGSIAAREIVRSIVVERCWDSWEVCNKVARRKYVLVD